MQKPTIKKPITNGKRLPWCELINPYNFFIVNVFPHTSRKTSRRHVEAPKTLESLGSFKVSASVSEATTSRLGFVSVAAQKVSCTSLPLSKHNVLSCVKTIRFNASTTSVKTNCFCASTTSFAIKIYIGLLGSPPCLNLLMKLYSTERTQNKEVSCAIVGVFRDIFYLRVVLRERQRTSQLHRVVYRSHRQIYLQPVITTVEQVIWEKLTWRATASVQPYEQTVYTACIYLLKKYRNLKPPYGRLLKF